MIINLIDLNTDIFLLDNEYILQPLEQYVKQCIDAGYYIMRIKIKGLNINFLIDYLKSSNTEEFKTLITRFPVNIFFDLTNYATSKKTTFRKALDIKEIIKIIAFTKSRECNYIYHIIVNDEIQSYLECDQSSDGSE